MAYEVPILQTSFTSTNDLSGSQFCLVKIDVANDLSVVIGAANADDVFGVVTNKPTAGQTATVICLGITKVYAGGTITRGDPLMSDASGHAVTRTGDAPSVGLALESGASGGLITMLVWKSGIGLMERNTVVSFHIDNAQIATGAIFTYTPGIAGTIKSISYVVDVPVTTGSKLATLTPNVAGTPTTGGAVALTSATMTPVGTEIKGSAITALNVFTAAQAIGVTASAVTTFVEGSGTVAMVIGA